MIVRIAQGQITAEAVLIDTIIRDFHCAWVDAWIIRVTVPASQDVPDAITVPVECFGERRNRQATETALAPGQRLTPGNETQREEQNQRKNRNSDRAPIDGLRSVERCKRNEKMSRCCERKPRIDLSKEQVSAPP